jgi:putative transposase
MSYLRIWIHLVWSTKNREPLLTGDIRKIVFQHIRENGVEKDIHIDFINGYTDHVHCLISLQHDQTISNLVRLIKGESSHWINSTNLTLDHFEWQDEYYAVSISESMVDKVRDYIKNQEVHHSRKSFEEEENEMIEKYHFKRLSF